MIEDRKPVAVKADQSHLSPQPDKAIPRLKQRLHGILRQAVLHPPRLAAVVGQRSGRVQCQARDSAAQQQCGCQKAAQRSRAKITAGRRRAPGGLFRCIHRIGEIMGHEIGDEFPQTVFNLRKSCALPQ